MTPGPFVGDDRPGPGGQGLEGHDPGHLGHRGRRPALPDPVGDGREGGVGERVAEGDPRHLFAGGQMTNDGPGRLADRSLPAGPGRGHGEGDSFDRQAREGLAHDGLGPADGIDRGGWGHHPVGPAQRRYGPHREQVGFARADTDADQAAGNRRVDRADGADRAGSRDRLGQGGVEGGPDEVGFGPSGLGGPAGQTGLQPVGEIEAALAHRPSA